MNSRASLRGRTARDVAGAQPVGMRRRTILFVGLVLAVGIPAIIVGWLGLQPGDFALFAKSMAASSVAITLGFYISLSLSDYPGNRPAYFILPVYSASFAVVFVGLILFRIDYSRALLICGFVVHLTWMYAVTLARRAYSYRIGVVPYGEIDTLREIAGATWLGIKKPSIEQIGSCDAIVADLHADLPDAWERFLADATLAGFPVFHVKQLAESLTGRVRIDHMSENSFGALIPLKSYLQLKRIIDVVTAIVALAFLAPFLLCVAIMIRIDSPGSPIFVQRRMGFRGRPFTMIKFRTMIDGSGRQDELRDAMTEDNDPRVTRVGRFLRRSRIDELPQIINILRGEMSWIGPRPEAEVLSTWYEQKIPFYRYRHVIRPGITGWAQVNQGHVAEVDEVIAKLEYDFYYIRHFSIWLDALVFARTVMIMFTGFGSR